MDKKITELTELASLTGNEYFVVADKEGTDNYKVNANKVKTTVTVDADLSETSKNPILNKAVTEAINDLEDRLTDVEESSNIVVDIEIDSVKTNTIESGLNAKVQIHDNGTVNNVKHLSFVFDIPKGEQGEQGTTGEAGTSTRTVTAYKHADEKPEKPKGGSWNPKTNEITYPEGWSPTDNLPPHVYMSSATFDHYGIIEDWSDPIRVTGEDGVDGTDGVNLEFIYKLFFDIQDDLETPYSNPYINDYIPEGWLDHPEGITEQYKCEYVCSRSKNPDTQTWGLWSEPTIWSKWGENGKDGDGIEYIYQLTLDVNYVPATPGTTPSVNSPVTDYLEREFIPASSIFSDGTTELEWTDNPTGVSETFECEYVSTRKFKFDTQEWGPFSKPALWAKWSEDGRGGQFTSVVFCRTNDTPIAPTDNDGSYTQPVPKNNVKNTAGQDLGFKWSDGIPNGSAMLWSTQRVLTWNGQTPLTSWSTPAQMTDTADFDVEFNDNEVFPGLPGTPGVPNNDQNGWSDNSTEKTVWMATSTCKNGVWSNWNILKVKGEKGDAGTSITMLGSIDVLPDELTYTGNVGDSYYVNGSLHVWDGDSWRNCGNFTGDPGLSAYVHIKYGNSMPVADNWSDWTAEDGETPGPFIGVCVDNYEGDNMNWKAYTWSKFTGDDGFGYEYIFKRTTTFNAPDVPTEKTAADVAPSGWTDDPSGVDPTNKYEWCCYRTIDAGGKNASEWKGKKNEPTKAWLFAMYAESIPGATGQQGPIVYPAGIWDSNTPYTQDIETVDGKEVVKATPYVLYGEDYYILDAASSKGNNPSEASSIYWKQMDKFDVVYAKILLANNALVGKAVFNGDYIFSQRGINANGEATTGAEYKNFNAENPYLSTNEFRPNWCVNLVTGAMWTGAGNSYFAADGSGYLANNKMSWTSAGVLTLPPTASIQASKLGNDIYVNYSVFTGSASTGGITLYGSRSDLTYPVFTKTIGTQNNLITAPASGSIVIEDVTTIPELIQLCWNSNPSYQSNGNILPGGTRAGVCNCDFSLTPSTTRTIKVKVPYEHSLGSGKSIAIPWLVRDENYSYIQGPVTALGDKTYPAYPIKNSSGTYDIQNIDGLKGKKYIVELLNLYNDDLPTTKYKIKIKGDTSSSDMVQFEIPAGNEDSVTITTDTVVITST